MKLKQMLIVMGVAVQVAILSLTLYFLHAVNQRGDESFDEIQDEVMASVDEGVSEKGVKVPFANYVMGSGRVACSKYIRVSAKREGILENLFVQEGDYVMKGDPLFQIEQGSLSFAFREKLADYEMALAELKENETNALKAVIQKKEIGLQSAQQALADCRVVSSYEGRILKVNVHPGEYVAPSDEALVIGCDTPLHLSVLIDEKEMWRVSPSKSLRAIALHKTNPAIHFVLDYVTVKPAISLEEKNEGMLEILFSFDKGKAPLYLDQTLDVYIEAASKDDTSYLDFQFNQK